MMPQIASSASNVAPGLSQISKLSSMVLYVISRKLPEAINR
jgi:hypothetical protein